MSKYGPGLTSGKIANMEKDEIKHALQGEVIVGENKDGFEYAEASKEACNKVILEAYDALYHQLDQALASGRALEMIAKARGYESNLAEYMAALEATKIESDYIYEGEEK